MVPFLLPMLKVRNYDKHISVVISDRDIPRHGPYLHGRKTSEVTTATFYINIYHSMALIKLYIFNFSWIIKFHKMSLECILILLIVNKSAVNMKWMKIWISLFLRVTLWQRARSYFCLFFCSMFWIKCVFIYNFIILKNAFIWYWC